MNNEEAIKLLQNTVLIMVGKDKKSINDVRIALDLAIRSLKAWNDLPYNANNLIIEVGQKDNLLK
ncbi:MAG: hypothetical protein IJV31_00555 [Clostridia bacterium]|nr:hypothetical protein [Clostridia bacterium]